MRRKQSPPRATVALSLRGLEELQDGQRRPRCRGASTATATRGSGWRSPGGGCSFPGAVALAQSGSAFEADTIHLGRRHDVVASRAVEAGASWQRPAGRFSTAYDELAAFRGDR